MLANIFSGHLHAEMYHLTGFLREISRAVLTISVTNGSLKTFRWIKVF